MTKQTIKYWLCGIQLTLVCLSETVYGSHYEQNWSKINQYSPVENFQSQGSYGWRLGLGYWESKNAQDTSGSREDSVSSPETVAVPTRIPRLQISKGTSFPLDFGLSIARIAGKDNAWQLGGHMQWTIWEAFQRPTLALRLKRMETSGLEGLDRLRTDAVQLGSSYAVIRFLTISAAVGYQWETWAWNENESQMSFVENQTLAQNQKRSVLSWGAHLQLFSPFYALSFEQNRLSTTDFINHLKFSVQL